MNKSQQVLERYNQLQEDRAEFEEIRKFEEEIQKEYGPIVAVGEQEIVALIERAKKQRLENASR